jgi:hypothetical protein
VRLAIGALPRLTERASLVHASDPSPGGLLLARTHERRDEHMGRGDNRRTMKMRRRKAQTKLKLRLKKRHGKLNS